MKEGTRGTVSGPARQRLRGALIVAEVALSFALLIGAGCWCAVSTGCCGWTRGSTPSG